MIALKFASAIVALSAIFTTGALGVIATLGGLL